MEREGDNIIVTADVIRLLDNVALRVFVFTKNREDPGDGTSAGFFEATADGRHYDEFGDLKELVRYKYRAVGSGGDRGDYAFFRTLTPVWFDDVRASTT